mgnify:CR=1 FL=1
MDASCNAKPAVVAVVGPTATGKTALGVALAEQFGGTFATEDQLTTALSFMLGTLRATREKEAAHE